MKKRIVALLLCILALMSHYQTALHPDISSRPIRVRHSLEEKILLVPLDGRPPCRQFVVDMGRIAGYEVTVPPSDIQDYYSLPGDTAAIKNWIRDNLEGSHALILSMDQLLYGGLLAAREKDASEGEISSLLEFLEELHKSHPDIPIYAFSILPRLTPQDTIDGYYERRHLMEYSRLMGKKTEGIPVEEDTLEELKGKISQESMAKYLSHFHENTAFNKKLIQLAKRGILTRLILGQDDGEAYGIPNIEKAALHRYLKENGIPEEKVFLTHGADEIALTLLAEIRTRETGFHPRIFLGYNDASSKDRIMPYMAVSTGETAEEKLRMLGALPVGSPEEADFTLFISTNDSDADTLGSRSQSLDFLRHLEELRHPVALVDLSKHFQKAELLLPLLIREDYPINSLIAYAGWNTTSNSIGTALAQGILFTGEKKRKKSLQDTLCLYASNLTFLQNRILEDSFYLKDVIDSVNASLIKEGYTNTADLDLERNFRWANAMLQHAMGERIASYRETKAFRQPIPVSAPDGETRIRIRHLSADLSYPWPRTFEIHLESSIALEEVEP